MEGHELHEADQETSTAAGGQEPGRAAGFIPLASLDEPGPARLDLNAVRKRLENARGRQYWRSLDELANTDEFQRYLAKEFPLQAPRDYSPLSRREFMRVMGATLALAGVGTMSGCGWQPPEQIVPYVNQPENLVPGKPQFFTTAYTRGGYAMGLLAESRMGRPIKLEGNPDHPASLGATDPYAQGSLLQLYDPDRSQVVRQYGNTLDWNALTSELNGWMQEFRAPDRRGRGLYLLLPAFTSPTLTAQLTRLLRLYPNARVYQHDAVGRETAREGARLAFGTDVQPVYRFDQARRILSLDCDFLLEEPGNVAFARQFSNGRRIRGGNAKDPNAMNRLYVVESTHSLTGANADHRLAVRPSQVEPIARAIAAGLGVGGATPGVLPEGVRPEWIAAVVEDLRGAGGAALVVAGSHQSAAVHAIAHAINQSLGAVNSTVMLGAPVEPDLGARMGTLAELTQAMNAGQVEALLILDSNPVYAAPADVPFADALKKLNEQETTLFTPDPANPNPGSPGARPRRLTLHIGLHDDETAALCQWHAPLSHYLETWSDARAYDGTATIIQPLITPLYGTKSVHELLDNMLGQVDRYGYEIVREFWRTRLRGDFETLWHGALLKGIVPEPARPAPAITATTANLAALPPSPATEGDWDIVFRPDPTIWDGTYSNNGWLQELPKPISKLTWDNAAYVSPRTAAQKQLNNRDLVEITVQGHRLTAAVWVLPGQPDNTITLHLGYGRTRPGRVGQGMGFNANSLRTTQSPWFASGVQVRKTGGTYNLVSAQHHFNMEGRDLVRIGTAAQYAAATGRPDFMRSETEMHETGGTDSLWPQKWPSQRTGVDPAGDPQHGEHPGDERNNPADEPYITKGYNDQPLPAWGMLIDLTACIGCGTCTIACQAENNIPTVGKDQVDVNREMHWIRVGEYFIGDPFKNHDEPVEAVFQPVPCMHCENAPCEPVCPVEATSHSVEGINEMTYNRCIGTRYCSNNCPYKVRRFNYLQYSDQQTPTIKLMFNPDVTVRSRGVMEKCTYCIQRINNARIEIEKERPGQPLQDGDVVTACAQACPTRAIIFGDVNDRHSRGGKGSLVRELKQEPHHYALLTELNTRPRTSYLAEVRNPNPALANVTARTRS